MVAWIYFLVTLPERNLPMGVLHTMILYSTWPVNHSFSSQINGYLPTCTCGTLLKTYLTKIIAWCGVALQCRIDRVLSSKQTLTLPVEEMSESFGLLSLRTLLRNVSKDYQSSHWFPRLARIITPVMRGKTLMRQLQAESVTSTKQPWGIRELCARW